MAVKLPENKLMTKKIKINLLKERIYENEIINYNAKQVSIILRMGCILFTDLSKVWEFNPENSCFYEIDLKEKIEVLLKGTPISHSFKKAVMDYLPLLTFQQIKDYGHSSDFKNDDLEKNTPMKLKYLELVKNEQYVNRKIAYNVHFNENLKNEYEVISFND